MSEKEAQKKVDRIHALVSEVNRVLAELQEDGHLVSVKSEKQAIRLPLMTVAVRITIAKAMSPTPAVLEFIAGQDTPLLDMAGNDE